MLPVLANPSLPTPALTHIAAVYNYGDAWKVHAVYLRGQVPAKRFSTNWIFVPSSVKVGDEILHVPGTTAYADPDWAEWYVSDRTGPTPKVRL